MRYLTKAIVITVNKKTILSHGGNFVEPFNYLNEHNLDYLLEIVRLHHQSSIGRIILGRMSKMV